MKGIFPALLKTAAFTYPISLIINFMWSYIGYHNHYSPHDFGAVALLLVVGTLFILAILLGTGLPALFLMDKHWWEKPVLRFALYFGGPLLFVVIILVQWVGVDSGDAICYAVIGIVFLIFHWF